MAAKEPSGASSLPLPDEELRESLRARAEIFRTLYAQAPLCIEIYDRRGCLVDVNPAGLEMFGVSRLEDALPYNLFEAKSNARVAKARVDAGEVVRYETEIDFDRIRETGAFPTTNLGRRHYACVLARWGEAGEGPGGYLLHLRDITEQKRAEAKLHRTLTEMRQLTDIINSSPVLAFVWRVEPGVWPVELVSENVTEVLGYTPEDFRSGRVSWPGITHPDDVPRLETEVAGYLEEGRREWAQEYRLITKSGEVRWFRDNNRALPDAQGRVTRIQSMVRDVTERKKAQEALRESEDKYRTLVEDAEDFIFSADADSRILSVNAAGARLLRMNPQEIVGRKVFDLYPEELATAYSHSLKQVFETGENLRVERRLVAGGRELWINTSLSPMRNADGRVVSVLGISRDITARRRAEEALAASEERLRRVITNVPVVLFAVDQHGVFTLSEGKGLAALGLEPGEVVGRSVFEVYADVPRIGEAIRRTLAGEPCTYTAEVQGLVFETWLYPLNDAQGVTGVIGVAADVTERRRAEEERRRLEESILHAQKLESLGILAGGIAHDFNNLLTGILGNAELALLDLSGTHPAVSKVEEIRSIAIRAAELANQMLAYSGRGQFVVETLDLTTLVREMTHLLEVSIARGVTLQLDLADDLPPVEGDATQLRQVVMNLVTNASEAMDDRDGVITLGTAVVHMDRADLAAAHLGKGLPEGRYVVLEVTDTGHGMDEETRSRIFDPFFTTKFTGRGLGLASVSGIVRGHRGAVHVASEPGRGTTFQVMLPTTAHPLRKTMIEERPSQTGWRGHGAVLVVDDERTVRDVARRMLETVGFDVLTADEGRRAVEMLAEHADRVTTVLLDMTMPRTDGEETLDQLRRIRPDLPVLLTSGYDDRDAAQRFGGDELCGFIQKPFRMTDLLSKVREMLER